MNAISTFSLSSPLRASITAAQTALSQDQTEVSSGTLADIGLTLGAGTGAVLSFKSQIDQLNGYTNSNATVATRLSTTNNVLSTMLSSAQTFSAALVTASNTGGDTASLQTTAQNALQSLISGLNTSAGGQSVFGGINTTTTPLADYFSAQPSAAKQAVDQAFEQTFGTTPTSSGASSISAADMQSYLDNQFGSLFSDSGWQSSWSSATDATMQSSISPTQSLTTSVSANNTAFRQIAQAYTMISEYTGANSTLSASAQAAVVSTASTLLNSGIAALTNVQTNVGTAQTTLDTASTQISAQVNVLQTNINDVDSVDTYALSSQISALQTQLEASYELTSRLQSLSLTNYLTAG